MNDWQKRFTQKVETVRNASSERFEDVANRTLHACFEEFHQFTAQHGLVASAPMSKPGIRTFKFAMTENAYALLTFKLSGLEGMELLSEFVIPSRGKLPPINQTVELSEANDVWTRRAFEQALDYFVDAFVESMDGQGKSGKQVPVATPA